MRNAIVIFVCVLVGACSSDDGTCKRVQEVHAWKTLEWPADNYHLSVKNNTNNPAWDDSLAKAIEDWNNLNTGLFIEQTTDNDADILVIEKSSNYWLGLAEVWTSQETGYIVRGRLSMSTVLLSGYSSNAVQHVMCQELGHLLALGHTTGDTCMDDCSAFAPRSGARMLCLDDPNKTTPNNHDREQLVLLYGEYEGECQ